jgi:hypothetical protein
MVDFRDFTPIESSQEVVWQRGIKVVGDPHLSLGETQSSFGAWFYGHQTGHWDAGARDSDFFARRDPLEQTREMRLRLMDIHFHKRQTRLSLWTKSILFGLKPISELFSASGDGCRSRLESHLRVGAIAEWLVGGSPAAAKSNLLSRLNAITACVKQGDLPRYQVWAFRQNLNRWIRHFFLLSDLVKQISSKLRR